MDSRSATVAGNAAKFTFFSDSFPENRRTAGIARAKFVRRSMKIVKIGVSEMPTGTQDRDNGGILNRISGRLSPAGFSIFAAKEPRLVYVRERL